MEKATTHSIERTSPKGGPFIGTCRLCGRQGLTSADALKYCDNPRHLGADDALVEALEGKAMLARGSNRVEQKALGDPPGFKDRRNIYVCDECKGHIVTVDLEAGVTPFMLPCHCKEGCKGRMQSSMYRVFDQRMAPSHEWYRPSAIELGTLTGWLKSHVERGGLLLRKVT